MRILYILHLFETAVYTEEGLLQQAGLFLLGAPHDFVSLDDSEV